MIRFLTLCLLLFSTLGFAQNDNKKLQEEINQEV